MTMRFDRDFDNCYFCVVMKFFEGKLHTWCFLALGLLDPFMELCIFKLAVAIYKWLTCWFLPVFTLMSAEIIKNNNLVYVFFADIVNACVSFILINLAETEDIKVTITNT
jgi:hypothetical protein